MLNQAPPVHDIRLPLELVSIAGALFTFAPHGFQPHLNPPLWSLGVEIWFSVLFPAVVLAFHRWGAIRIILAATAVSWISRGLGAALSPDHPDPAADHGPDRQSGDLRAGHGAGPGLCRRIRVRWPQLVTLGGVALVALSLLLARILGHRIEIPFSDLVALGFAAMIAGLLSLEAGWLRASFANGRSRCWA